MQIDTKDVKAIFSFTSRTHILVEADGQWSLNPRISREFKGKDDDIGSPEIFISDRDAEALKASGFSYTSLNIKG